MTFIKQNLIDLAFVYSIIGIGNVILFGVGAVRSWAMGYICIITMHASNPLQYQTAPLSGGLMEEGFGKLHIIHTKYYMFVQPQKSTEDCTITK